MTRSNRRPWRLVGLAVAISFAFGWAAPSQPASAAEPALAVWDGGVDLYRKGTFTTQRSWLWCTAAGVQIVRNIVDDEEDHSTSAQRRYFNFMREHNRYTLPLSAGVDPQGWTAGLREYVDDRYRLVTSTTFDNALRSAVKRIRLTNLPVALTVAHGNHGWILTGFTATADPSESSSFKVTSVRVVGPLYGLQSRNGYDMPPDTKLTPTQLKRFFTPWKYAPKAMIWDGRYVSIQPVPVEASTSAASSTAASESMAPGAAAAASPTLPAITGSPTLAAGGAGIASPLASPAGRGGGTDVVADAALIGVVAVVMAGLAVVVVVWLARSQQADGRRSGPGSARVPG